MTKTSTIGLIELTTQRQANNGTQCFHDPIAGCYYLSYESGYVRRKYSGLSYRGYTQSTIYQLNKTQRVRRESMYTPGRFYDCVERIMEMNPENRIDIIVRATTNFRKYLRKYQKK
jgi:hypothetical protein